MKNTLRLTVSILLIMLLLPMTSLAQEGKLIWSDRPETIRDLNLVWNSSLSDTDPSAQPIWARITGTAQNELPANIIQIKNIKADVDLDGDGKREFMVPVLWDDGGTNRRSVFVFENTGDDAYTAVWSYQFPGEASEFVTVDVSDLDGDGTLEILAVNVRAPGDDDAGPNLYVFENQGDDDYGTEPTVTWDLGNSDRDIVRVAKAADFDGDGQQEVVMTSLTTQPSIVVASVSDFAVPVWTSEFVNNDIGGNAPDIAAIGVGDMDNDGNLEIVMTEGGSEQLVVLEGAGADTYDQVIAAIPLAGKTVSVHGIDLADANGDGQDEAYIANLQGAVWVVSTDDVSTLATGDIYLIEDTEEQWLEASTGDLGGGSLSFVIAASNASTAESYQYTGGPGGDVTDPGSYSRTQLVEVDDFVNVVPGGLRVYGLDVAGDMDGDGNPEVLFTRGSDRGGRDAPAIFVVELEQEFNVANGALPAQILQIKNIKADVDLDGDGKREFMVPVLWDDGGTNRRSVFVFENTGDDAYAAVWSYQFPGEASEFVTVDVSDLDGDGALEILAVNVRAPGDDDAGPNLYVFENQGDNDYGTDPTVTWDLGSATRDVVRVAKAADFDGDGQQEVVLTSFTTQPAIVVASVSDFALPVWTSEYVNNDIGGSAPDIAAIGVGDMDGDGNLEIVMTEGASEQLVVLEGAGADTYTEFTAPIPLAGKTVSVHGIDLADANGDGQDEAYIANLQGAVWVVSTDDVSTLATGDIYLIEDTEEQWLEASTGDLGGGSLSFVIAASNASTAESYQYTGGPGGDVTDPGSYSRTQLVEVDDFVNVVPGGLRVYGLDVAGDMDGDGNPEVLFTRGSDRGGRDAPAIFVVELEQEFNVANGALPAQILQIKNIKADVDLDGDGKREFMVPVLWDDGGTNRRSVFVFENTGDDAYAAVWSYQFPGEASEFVTVDVSDLDGDGALEILAVNVRAPGDDDAGPNLYVFENQGDNDYGTDPTVTWDLGSATRDVVRVAKAADFDGDGQQEVVLTSFTTQPAIVVASVSDFALPVWTSEYVNNDIGGSAPDIAAIGVGDMDGDGNLEIVMTEGASEQLVVLEGAGADTYTEFTAPIPLAGKTVSVHGIDLADANGDGQDEAYIANLQGAVWVVSTDDVSTLATGDIYLIEDTEEQWLEASTGDLGGGSLSFVIAASNASTAESYQYTGGPGGDVTDPGSYSRTQLVEVDDFVNVVPGGLRVYGLDVAGDMDGDGNPEVLFTRGSDRGGRDAPAIFVVELEQGFNVAVEEAELPGGFALHQNYPNPFNPETNIAFTLTRPGTLTLSIYNLLGQRIATLAEGYQAPQSYTVRWNGTDDSGSLVPSGLYLYRLEVDGMVQQKTMLLIK